MEPLTSQLRTDHQQVADPGKDNWSFGPMEGPYEGDCEDFALTLAKRYFGSEDAALEAFASGEAVIHYATIHWEGEDFGHAVLELDGYGFIDSSDRYWRDSVGSTRYDNTYGFAYSYDALVDKLNKEEGSKLFLLLGVLVLIGAAVLLGGGV